MSPGQIKVYSVDALREALRNSANTSIEVVGSPALISTVPSVVEENATPSESRAGPRASPSRQRRWGPAILAALIILGPVPLLYQFVLASRPAERPAQTHTEPQALPSDEYPPILTPVPTRQVPRAPTTTSSSVQQYIPIAWIALIALAIILTYLLARQAIGEGADVDWQWKITEKASGRIKITRTRPRKG